MRAKMGDVLEDVCCGHWHRFGAYSLDAYPCRRPFTVSPVVVRAQGGGEYATQIGFGWTNGVLVALGALYSALQQKIDRAVPATQATGH